MSHYQAVLFFFEIYNALSVSQMCADHLLVKYLSRSLFYKVSSHIYAVRISPVKWLCSILCCFCFLAFRAPELICGSGGEVLNSLLCLWAVRGLFHAFRPSLQQM